MQSNSRGFDRDFAWLLAVAAIKWFLHVLTDGQYGFHRDELQTLSDARHLDWGFVAYPPLTPFLGHIELLLFGPALTGFRFFAALAQSIVFVVAGLMTRRLGGGRAAMWLAALATALAPVSLSASSLFMYVSFDYLWFVLLAYFIVCRIDSGDARWWLAIGAVIGVGMMTKYTMAFFALGVIVGVIVTPLRADLRSRWLWFGVALALLIFLPNVIWQMQHDFITLTFLQSIHARDVRIGRADSFWLDQLYIAANAFSIPLWLLGLWFVWATPQGKRWRILGWMALIPFAILVIARGRGYYAAPLYPMLLAAGAVQLQTVLAGFSAASRRRKAWVAAFVVIACGAVMLRPVLPLVSVNSPSWARVNDLNGDFREEFGWPELERENLRIWNTLSAQEREHAVIFASNYGEAGALELFGPADGLPQVISAVNSFWLRGSGDAQTQTIIVNGSERKYWQPYCDSLALAGHTYNDANVSNEETKYHPDIFVCRGVHQTLRERWPALPEFG